MTWRAHPLRLVPMPERLPLSLPAGVRTLRFGQRALTVPVLREVDWPGGSPCYWALWTFNPTVKKKPKTGSFYGPMACFSIDWSTV